MVERMTANDVVVVSGNDFTLLGEREFGMPGIRATEVIGPFVRTQAVGPLIMLHEGVIDPHHGIGHHPHRTNERLFYMLAGALDHDDSLNGITGHMGPGDVARLTEGRIGMFHKEWNNTDETARAFILVYGTDPMPERASFEALRDQDAPRYEEGRGVRTKELVGRRSPLPVHGDIRFFADTDLESRAELGVRLDDGEGAVLAPIEGQVSLDGRALTTDDRALLPPGDARSLAVRAGSPARLLRVTFGPGYGLVVQEPRR
jgi:redox-sensitive bicupin YhaK (pirin superfamily)